MKTAYYVIVFFFIFTSSLPIEAGLTEGFQEEIVFRDLSNPVAIRFAPNGEVFIAEKSGIIKRYDSITDTTPEIFADLRTNVYNFWDRGLLGLAIHPNWPATKHIYVAYAYDGDIGGPAPKYGQPNVDSDPCPTNPTGDGCEVSGRLSRLSKQDIQMTETVLIEDWCQVFPSHSIGDLKFGPDGALYMSGGDGASFTAADFGQLGKPVNFCGDPSGEGGALRSQDILSRGDPLNLNGTILRLDPASDLNGGHPAGPLLNNPSISSPDMNERRIIGYGLRNPYRFTIRPGTNELWIGDVGWSTWEEINRIVDPTAGVVNFGWPCYEGNNLQTSYDQQQLCKILYNTGNAAKPYFTYNHNTAIAPGDKCGTGGSSITGLAFYDSDRFPAQYHQALFGADYSRSCIWVMFPGTNGLPDINYRKTFHTTAESPVDLQVGPDGNLYYADLEGTVRRIKFGSGSAPESENPPPPNTQLPVAKINLPTATTKWSVGEVIQFSGSAKNANGTPIPDADLKWMLNIHHCVAVGHCHVHHIRGWDGISEDTFIAPDHEYPSFLEIVLTAKSSDGKEGKAAVLMDPKIMKFKLESSPSKLQLIFNEKPITTPYSTNVILGATVNLEAPNSQKRGSTAYLWDIWSDTKDRDARQRIRSFPMPKFNKTLKAKFSTNKSPKAKFTVAPKSARGKAPLTLNFNGSTSSDANREPLTYSWTFGDGTSASGAVVSHTFGTRGKKKVTLKVSDPHGKTHTTSKTIRVD
jgi:glucose/arabinose dehydrogenase